MTRLSSPSGLLPFLSRLLKSRFHSDDAQFNICFPWKLFFFQRCLVFWIFLGGTILVLVFSSKFQTHFVKFYKKPADILMG